MLHDISALLHYKKYLFIDGYFYRIKKDEEGYVNNYWDVNPWLENDVDDVIALSSCMITPPDVQAYLQQARSLGKK